MVRAQASQRSSTVWLVTKMIFRLDWIELDMGVEGVSGWLKSVKEKIPSGPYFLDTLRKLLGLIKLAIWV